jgi:hypothetical protein
LGVRLSLNLENGSWLELRRLDHSLISAYVTNEHIKISDKQMGIFKENEFGEELLKFLSINMGESYVSESSIE